jgi:hypothetical protein
VTPSASPVPKASLLQGNATRILIAAVAAALVIVVVALAMHALGAGTSSERYTAAEFRSLPVGGLSLRQLEARLGGPPTKEKQFADGTASAYWVNPDGSYIWIGFDQGLSGPSMGKASAGPHGKGDLEAGLVASASTALGGWGRKALMALLAAVVLGACLFVAAMLFGYSLTGTQTALFAVATGIVGLVPFVGLPLALVVGASIVARWTSASWWMALLIVLLAVFAAALVVGTVFSVGFGLGMAL